MANLGMILKVLCSNLAFFFMIYSLYFTGDYELSFLKGIGCFFLLAIFCYFLAIIPFGHSLSPILFEWWWHDIPFWEFSKLAWGLSIANFVCIAFIFIGVFFYDKESG
jgi:hypothetical protein